MFRKLSDEELQEWLEKQMEKENRSLENNFFSRVFGRKDDITDEELDRFFADAMELLFASIVILAAKTAIAHTITKPATFDNFL